MVTRLSILTGWLALLSALPAFAQVADPTLPPPAPLGSESADAAEARLAFDEGLRLLRAEQWQDAEASFRRSLAHVSRPSAKYNLAFVLYKQGRLHQSSELLQELLSSDDPALDARYRDYAKVLLSNVLAAVSVLHLVISPDTAEVRVDGELVAVSGAERSVPVDPGTHQVQVSAPGFVSQVAEVVAPARGEEQREITLSRLPSLAKPSAAMASKDGAPTRSAFATAGPWVTIGLGAALLVAGAVTGVLSKDADADFTKQCPTLEHCSPQLRRTGDKVKRLATATNILLVSGAAFAVAGVSWRLLLPAPDRQRSALVTASIRF